MPAALTYPARPGLFAFDKFELDVPAFELRRDGQPVAVEPQVFEVLAFLVENAGKVLTKDEILDRVWPERYVSEASLNSRVMTARKALGDSGAVQRYIKTIHGRGYRFTGIVESAAQPGATPDAAEGQCSTPAPATSFIGREDELARLGGLLANSSCRLLTVVGPGGMGKTRLVCEFVDRLRDAGENVVGVALEHASASEFLPIIADALGVKANGEDLLHAIARFPGSEPRVLVLDNLEHLLAAAGPFLETLVAVAPKTKVVATSRVRLGLPHEWLMRIEGLKPENTARLFLERAGQYGGPAESAQDLEAISQSTGGMPLAVELAAALTRYLPVSRVCEMLAEDATGAINNEAGGRRSTIESLFEANLERLDDGERSMLASLAAFGGTFDTEAAGAVAGADLRSLGRLVDVSLVIPREGRFSVHPLLRAHLRERFGPTLDSARKAHTAHFARFTEARTAVLRGGGQLHAMAELDPEMPDVIAAWRHAVATADFSAVERMNCGLFTHLIFRGRFSEAGELANVGLAATDDADPDLRSSLLVYQAWTGLRLGKTNLAIDSATEAMALARHAELPWKAGFGADPRFVVAALRMGAGDYPGCLAVAQECLRLAVAAGDQAGEAFAAWLAACARFREAEYEVVPGSGPKFVYRPLEGELRIDEAAGYIARAAELLEAGEVWLSGFVENERGLQAMARGEWERGCAHFRRAYQLRRKLNDPQGMASALVYLADALRDGDETDAGMALYPEIWELLARSGDINGVAEVLRSEGAMAVARGDLEFARTRLREALTTSQSVGFANNITGTLRAFGDLFALEGKSELAGRLFACVNGHRSSTPGSRARARYALEQLGQPGRISEGTDEEVEALAREVLRAAGEVGDWLRSDDRGAADRCAATASGSRR